VHDLLAEPSRFDGTSVTVVGWFVFEREHSAVYSSRGDAKSTARPGIWLVHPGTLGGETAVASLSGGWIRVTGLFANRRKSGCGHFNGWPAQLSALSELLRAEAPPEQSLA
jgi:hypothetical protein